MHIETLSDNNVVSKNAADHHRKASEHLIRAARHHTEASKYYYTGEHTMGAHHAHTARGHVVHARWHEEEAAKAHVEEHGKIAIPVDQLNASNDD